MNRYKYDTHVHTVETSYCGQVTGSGLVRLYREAGYDGVVITDHYYKEYFECLPGKSWEKKIDTYLTGFRKAEEEGRKRGLRVLLGAELRFEENYNDYLVFGMDEAFLKENEALYDLGLKRFYELTRGKDILIFQAHPFRPGMIPASPLLLDGVEVYNGNARHNSGNRLAREYARKHNLLMSSGSDFHQHEDLARGGIIVPETLTTPADLVRVLQEGGVLELLETNP